MRFRQGFPEKINGWKRISSSTYLGVCRSLENWITLDGSNLLGVGTHLKFYIEKGGTYTDITPVRETQALTDPFETTLGDETVTVTDTAHGAVNGDYVTFTVTSAVGGLTLNGEYQITYVDADSYTIEHGSAATSSSTGGGAVTAEYQVNTGASIATPTTGFGAGPFGAGPFGTGGTTSVGIQLWSQANFGEDLVFCPRGGPPCYWDATNGLSTRGILLSELGGATEVPTVANKILVSDVSRFIFAFGCNDEGSSVLDPMLVRWCDQEQAAVWGAEATNQAGGLRMSHGSEIITGIQARQEVLVWTDEALFGLQYVGTPNGVWSAQLVGDNMNIASQNAAIYVNNRAYWMGKEQFYIYDGTARVLECDLRKYVYNGIERTQLDQVHAGHNEAYSEVWWFYCSSNSTTIDRYVVYNYKYEIWYYGTLDRTAWIDPKARDNPLAATYSNNIVQHEIGIDDLEGSSSSPIVAYISSAEFDINEGDRFAFVRRVLPDITFDGSTAPSPSVTMTLYPLKDAGSDYKTPRSEGGNFNFAVTQGTAVDIEPFTGQAFVRIRGRQLVFRVESSAEGVTWQLGTPRLDMRTDGRKSA